MIDVGRLMNDAATAGARAVTLREQAQRMPARTPAERMNRDAAMVRASDASREATMARSLSHAAQRDAHGPLAVLGLI